MHFLHLWAIRQKFVCTASENETAVKCTLWKKGFRAVGWDGGGREAGLLALGELAQGLCREGGDVVWSQAISGGELCHHHH